MAQFRQSLQTTDFWVAEATQARQLRTYTRHLPSGHFDNAQLAILADALTDAGCDNEDILEHCRAEGPHVRGCWVVDLILDKS